MAGGMFRCLESACKHDARIDSIIEVHCDIVEACRAYMDDCRACVHAQSKAGLQSSYNFAGGAGNQEFMHEEDSN